MNPCIVIPVFNHERAIVGVVESLRPHGVPIILVDDGSSDACREVLISLAKAESSWVSLVRLDENQGKGGAVIAGLREAGARGFSHALQIDADGQHNAADVPRFLNEAAAHPNDCIAGRPEFDDSIPKGRLYGRYVTHLWVWINTLSLEVQDSMCGFRVYPLAAVLRLFDRVTIGRRMDFDVEVLVRLYWAGTRIRQLPTRVTYPADGVSHFKGLLDNVLISRMHAKLFFGMLLRFPVLLFRTRKSDSTADAQPTHWARIAEHGTTLGLWALLFVHRYIGRWVFSALLRVIMAYYFALASVARRSSRDFLRRLDAARPDLHLNPTVWTSYSHFLALGNAMLDKALAFTGELGRDDVVLHQYGEMADRVQRGQGGIVLTAHVGALEVMQSVSESNPKLTLNILVHSKNAQKFQSVLRRLKPTTRVRLVEVTELGTDTAMDLSQRVAAGEWVVVAADRIPVESDRCVEIDFLGARAKVPMGPYVLAGLLKCPALFVCCLKIDGRYHIFYETLRERIDWERSTRQRVMTEVAQQYADRLAFHIAKAPLQWFNFFPFWGPQALPPKNERHTLPSTPSTPAIQQHDTAP